MQFIIFSSFHTSGNTTTLFFGEKVHWDLPNFLIPGLYFCSIPREIFINTLSWTVLSLREPKETFIPPPSPRIAFSFQLHFVLLHLCITSYLAWRLLTLTLARCFFPPPPPRDSVVPINSLKLYIYVIVHVEVKLTNEMRNFLAFLFTFCTEIEYMLNVG